MSDDETLSPAFPPLFRGEQAKHGHPFDLAVARAREGVDPGLITFRIDPDKMSAALVLAPESPLEDAMAMQLVASIGFADALGALSPPEIGVHFEWPGILRVNGAKCGRVSTAASTRDPDVEPDWLVVGFELQIFPTTMEVEPGETPETTSLIEEGCGDIEPPKLLESWSRHTLVWINRYLDEGMPPIHAEWRSRAFQLGETISNGSAIGKFLGIDEKGGMLLQRGDKTDLIPLSLTLKEI